MFRYIIFLVGFCISSFSYSQKITFRAVLNNKPLIFNCNTPFDGSYINVELFKLYVSNVEFAYKDGSSFKERNSYHLIDLANPKDCELFISDAKKEIKQLSFDIGIDSATNYQGAKSGDLDPLKGMYWTWQSGYINFKIEGNSPLCSSSKNKFAFHIGGFQYPFNAIQHIVLDKNSANDITVEIKLDGFFKSVQLDQRTNVMSPGPKAMFIAETFKNAFLLKDG